MIFARNTCPVPVRELDVLIAHLCDGAGIDTPSYLRPRCEIKGMTFAAHAAMFGKTAPKCAAVVVPALGVALPFDVFGGLTGRAFQATRFEACR